MPSFYAAPQCFIELYPFEGGTYYIQGGQLLSLEMTKAFRADVGTFRFILAPGGPLGTAMLPTWEDIITPMSFVMIGMARGQYRQIVMIGVVTSIEEVEDWSKAPVTRRLNVSGADFGYFFLMDNWLSVPFLGGFTVSAATQITGLPGDAGLSALDPSLQMGTPDQVATHWFNDIMKKVLSKTYINWNNNNIAFPNFMGYWFQQYTKTIPLYDYYLASSGNWITKFREILEFPWFEVFIMTSPTGFFTQATQGTSFTMRMLGSQYPAVVNIIGRINPVPFVPVTTSGDSVSYGTVDQTLWNGLPLFQADTSYITSGITFSEAEVRNVYIIIPNTFLQLFGQQNSAPLSPFIFPNAGAFDAASITRYGFRPEQINTRYFNDPQGSWAQSGQINIFSLLSDLMSRVTSFYEPTPLMARCVAQFPLRPDILPAFRFRFSPGKGEPTWDFYIEAVTHNYNFGADSYTTLQLSRGLPTSIYSNQNDILTQMLRGNAQRLNGTYQVGLPSGSLPALQAASIGTAGQLAAFTGADKAWKTAQTQ